MILLKLFSKLPMPVLYLISDLLYLIIYYVFKYRITVVIKNIKNSFPDKSNTEIAQIAKIFYRRFCEYIVETIKGLTISEKEMTKRVKFINIPDVEPYAKENSSIILAGPHQFNWEWALLTGCLVLPFRVDAVYQKLSNLKMDKMMLNMRGKFGGKPIEKKNIVRQLILSKLETKAIAIVADQAPRKNDIKYWTIFMNQETAFFTGIEQIASSFDYPVFFFKMKRISRGKYTVELINIGKPPYKNNHSILENFVKATEELIKEDPSGYLWSHKRWKLKKSAR